jgi:hypothetical protein
MFSIPRAHVTLLICIFVLTEVQTSRYALADSCSSTPIPSGVLPQNVDAAAKTQNLPSNLQFDVLTQHNNIARTGSITHENILTPASVSGGTFGYLGSVSVNGKIYAQPLYVEKAAVQCGEEGRRQLTNTDVAFIATLENVVYAIDVDRQEVCWKTQPLGCGERAQGMLGMDESHEGNVHVGIVATPVVDIHKSVLYAVTRNYDTASNAHFFLNTLDTRTGTLIARVEARADNPLECGGHTFAPRVHNNRPGLLLVDNKLFVAFGSTRGEDDSVDYHGFVLGFDVANPARPKPLPNIFCTTPQTLGGGIWMSGNGLASDGSSIYFSTGNGAYHVANGDIVDPENQVPDKPQESEFPDSFVKLQIANLRLGWGYTDIRTEDEFHKVPYLFDQSACRSPSRTTIARCRKHTIFWARERSDADVGSSGVLLLGNRLIGGGKDGRLDVLDTNSHSLSQSFLAFIDLDTKNGTDPDYSTQYDYRPFPWYVGPNLHGSLVAWDVHQRPDSPFIYVYGWSEKDALKRFRFVPEAGKFLEQDAQDASPADPTPSAHGSVISALKSMPGGMLSISANGINDGIVWATIEEPYAPSHASHHTCSDGVEDCVGCYLQNGSFVEYCDAKQGYVPGRLYAFSADDNGIGELPLLWGDKRTRTPNNLIPRYSKFTPPTIGHGKVIVATANDEIRFYGLRTSNCSSCQGVATTLGEVIAVWNDEGSNAYAFYPSNGDSFDSHSRWETKPSDQWSASARWFSGDFDGDGLTDALAVWNDGGANTLTVRRSTGNGFVTQQWAIRDGKWVDSSEWLTGDFNGDGLCDVAVMWNDNGKVSVSVYLSDGLRFEHPLPWAKRDGGWGDAAKWVLGDFNGDGLADIASIWNDAGTNTITVRRSTRGSFKTEQWRLNDGGWVDSTKWVAGDFDGDGRCDIAALWNDQGKMTIAVYRSSGLQFAPHKPWALRDGGWDDSVKFVSGDFNGDGRADILSIWNNSGINTFTIRKSTGSSFSASPLPLQDGSWIQATKWLAGTFR